jgi:glucose-6-phosphate isomerase
MGLIGAWNRTFLSLPTLCVLPYDQRLARLPAYLQQLEMESNGKSVTLRGERVDYRPRRSSGASPARTRSIRFSRCCTRAPRPRPWISSRRCAAPGATPAARISRCRIASHSRRRSRSATRSTKVEAEMRAAGALRAEIARLAVHRVYEGNRPSSLLLYPQTTARTLGGLLALYEHSVFVQGVVWGVNSFDQFGVELGKKLATGIDLTGKRAPIGPGAAGLAALGNNR